jgi:DNA-binding MarR family transcriptional regulator
MNAILFAAKRAFQSAVRMSNAQLKEIARGLTAARFDMMYALTRYAVGEAHFGEGEMPKFETRVLERRTILQSELRQLLGVSAPVVSRMVRSLEALGWVARKRPECGDRRQREVTLTGAGFAAFRAAYGPLFHFAKRVVHRAICWGKHHDPDERFQHMAMLESYVCSLREYFRDRARLYYAWGHPED